MDYDYQHLKSEFLITRPSHMPTKLGDFGQGQMLGFIFQHHGLHLGIKNSLEICHHVASMLEVEVAQLKRSLDLNVNELYLQK